MVILPEHENFMHVYGRILGFLFIFAFISDNKVVCPKEILIVSSILFTTIPRKDEVDYLVIEILCVN